MTGPTATCELWVDGTRVADTGTDLVSGFATALSGLSLTWGRDGQNEQPGPASLSMDLFDPYGNDEALDLLHVGSEVEVWAEGSWDAGTGYQETFDDPSLESWPLGDAEANLYVAPEPSHRATVLVDDTRGQVLDIAADKPSVDYVVVRIPPRRFSPTGELPNAWDDKLQWEPFDKGWQVGVWVLAPAGSTISTQIPVYTGPYPDASTAAIAGPQVTATGQWQSIGKTMGVASGPSPGWLGITVFVLNLQIRWQDQAPARTWGSMGTATWETVTRVRVDYPSVKSPLGVQTRRVLAFSGEIANVELTPAGEGSTSVRAIAMDLGSQLGNTVIGDNPWPVQTLATRADRIAELAGITSSPRIRIDAPLGPLQVSYRDVDAQPAYGLLQDLAQTGGGILWCATHAVTGPYLWIENPTERASLRAFTDTTGLITITGTTEDVNVLSACDLLEDGAAWRQDTADVITVVAVTWLEQGTDDEGQVTTTERTVTVTDPTAITTYGTRRLSVSTELIHESDATNMANAILATARAVAWRLEGITLDTEVTEDWDIASVDEATREISLLNLLDGTSRMGAALTLVDMPGYAPRGAISSAYVEGGRYDFANGFWKLALATSPSAAQGHSATWAEIGAAHPTWKWNQWNPTVLWVQTYGVTV